MTTSHIFYQQSRRHPEPQPRRVLITGAAGRIGGAFAAASQERYDLTLMAHHDDDTSEIEACGTVVRATLDDLDRLKELFDGQDTIVHMAADPSPEAEWESMLTNNITGTFNTMTAAVAAGCRRVIYASSIHAVSGYEEGYQVHAADPVNPGDLYGVTKCFGEAMGRYIATQHGVSVIAIRIGAFQPIEAARNEESLPMLNAFISHRDMVQLLQCSIDDEELLFAIVHGLSDNLFNCMEIQTARDLLGYKPQDDFTREHPRLAGLDLDEKVQPHSERGGQSSGLRNKLDPP